MIKNHTVVGFTCSSFDLLHAGHVLMLEECKRMCDYLIVGLQTDPTIDRPGVKNKPVQSIFERQIQLRGCKYVDEIFVYDTEADLMNMIKSLPIHVRFVGEEYRNKDFTGKQWCEDNAVRLHFNTRRHDFSTTELRSRAGLNKK
jgi:glycerol-3-phosphate cytidylyltransferase